MIAEPQEYYDPSELAAETADKIRLAELNCEKIDYLTIVPDGEPTLDANLGLLLDHLKPFGIKTAVITNSTLLPRPEVRKALTKADWVSVKVDTMSEATWRKIDKPHRKLVFKSILEGVRAFSREYNGQLVTETMLVKDINDSLENIKAVASFLSQLNPSICYLSIPTRPPADPNVTFPEEQTINRCFQIFKEHGLPAEYLIGYEGNEFAYTGNIEDDILSITSVHPMREDAVTAYLYKAGGNFSEIEKLLDENKLIVSEYNNARFYLRKLRG
jgi:wyosine [tRNA(Phe)-imidazoG37] synthetase (radical SAM superfamily)